LDGIGGQEVCDDFKINWVTDLYTWRACRHNGPTILDDLQNKA
jgi:hypothetical protein